MKRAIGYVRVSTEEQASKGVSLDAQRAKVQAYAELHDLDLVDVVEDAGVSGKSLNRAGITKVLDAARRGDVDAVIIWKLDRLSRRTADILALVEGVFTKVELHSITDKLDTGSAAGRFVVTVLAGLAQMEREQIGERTASALAHKRAIGEAWNHNPFGYTRTGRKLAATADGREAIELILNCRRDGMTYRAIAAELEARDVATVKGGRWSAKVVRSIAMREAA